MAIVTLALSAVSMLVLIFGYADRVDPFATPASLYVYAGTSAAILFTSAVMALAFAGSAVMTGVRQIGVRLQGVPATLLGVWIGSVVLVGLFPTDPGAGVTSTSGWIHRVAAIGVLGILPIAGLFVATRLASRSARAAFGVRLLSVSGCVLAVACMLSRLVDQYPIDGLLQRMLFGVEIAILAIPAVMIAAVERAPIPAGVLAR
jgi:Protein of unknown function (DUF998)